MTAPLKVPTEIASSSSLPGIPKATSASGVFFAALAVAALALSGCANLRTRESVATGKKPGVQTPTPQATPHPSAQAPQPGAPAPTGPGQTTAPQPAPTPSTFLNKELPRVGVILTGGGMKSFAHLGALREFQRARIPIHAIAGLEWGAIMGGLYAFQGQVNDAEWKAFKLKQTDLPSGGGFLSTKMAPQSISSLSGFLDTAFAGSLIEKSKIEFACPTYSNRTDRTVWLGKGSYKDAMTKCVPYPPFYTDNGGSFASPFSIDEAANWLRSRGCNVIVIVNVLAGGEIFPAKLYNDQYVESLVWSEIRREGLRAAPPVVSWAINVNTTGYPITDFDDRRQIMDAGAKAATDVVNKMAAQYGF